MRLCHHKGASILKGLGDRDHQILGRVIVGIAGESCGGGRVVKYYYILSYAGSMFESGDF